MYNMESLEAASGLTVEQIDSIEIVGGASRVPWFKKMCSEAASEQIWSPAGRPLFYLGDFGARGCGDSCIWQGGPGSVRFGYGLGMERFKRFRFSVPAVPLQKKGFSVFQYNLTGKDGSSSGFGS